MNETQQKNIAVATYIIDELHKDKPFNLVLDRQKLMFSFWQQKDIRVIWDYPYLTNLESLIF